MIGGEKMDLLVAFLIDVLAGFVVEILLKAMRRLSKKRKGF